MTNIVIIVLRGNFTKQINYSYYLAQRKNSYAEESLKTAYYRSRDSYKILTTDWLKKYIESRTVFRIQSKTANGQS